MTRRAKIESLLKWLTITSAVAFAGASVFLWFYELYDAAGLRGSQHLYFATYHPIRHAVLTAIINVGLYLTLASSVAWMICMALASLRGQRRKAD